MEGTKFAHESYGMIDIHRQQNGMATTLFGSDVKHNHTIKLAIKTADCTRGLNNDWFYGKQPLIEIELSPVQFAEAITNMNTQGVPCTIKYFNGKHIEDCPNLNKKEIFRKEFQDNIKKSTNTINDLITKVEAIIDNKKPINKKQKEEILSELSKISMALNSNIPYMIKCFDEQIEKSVSQSKSEIEAYISHKINSLGLKALKEQNDILGIEDGGKYE